MKATPLLRILDCSNNNNQPIDWGAIKQAGASGGIYKSSEGISFIDQTFAANWSALKVAEMIRGAYHFALPDRNNPLAEADLFLRAIGHLDDYDIPALDVESGAGPYLAAWALAWLQDVESALKVPPLLYCNMDYATHYLTDPRLAHYPLWLALPDTEVCPPRIGVWDTVTLWQNSWTSQWPGIQGNVDQSVIARDLDGLKQLGRQPVPPPKPHPTPPTAKKYLVLVEMRCRPVPQDDSSFYPPQYAHVGAVLNGTGKINGSWVQVVAGGRPVWLLGSNLQAL